MYGTQLLAGRHAVVGSDFLRVARRECHNATPEDLLEYVVLPTGRRVVALWMNRDAGIVQDITSYHPVLDPPTTDNIQEVIYNSDPTVRMQTLQETLRQLLSEDRDGLRRHLDDEAERTEYAEHVRRLVPGHYRDHPMFSTWF